MPAHHDVRSSDVFTRRLHGTLAAAAERGPLDFPELLLTPGVGARTVRSLAMVAEVVHGAPYRFRDPARFSLAHGGKDRHPYPVPIKVYDETIRVLKSAVQNAKLGRDEEMQTLKRLDDQARRLERPQTARRWRPSSQPNERHRRRSMDARYSGGKPKSTTGEAQLGKRRPLVRGTRPASSSFHLRDSCGRQVLRRQAALATRELPMDENQIASLLGHAALKVWPDLPRDAQERLFAAAVDDGVIGNESGDVPARPTSAHRASGGVRPNVPPQASHTTS